ncbi:pyridoxamine 5'-phosphate oxidase family protein [Modestobacter sp. Leaf380]|uniref:pyridoxamine 5'-phosphate oxidase family protein n=1 Tax=Modestobacter sp. Leaf380 TaxID=1736356 RepID=UPI0006F95E40|nr:pyridoxamine 5'-phosphate oxidase family protein [Modestobacter sp. Leaf380]KQS68749.1 hypothetical protein ASG41_07475 [Modestobacter sp. Leaf380]
MTLGAEVHADTAPPADPVALAVSWLPADDDPDRPQVTLSTQGLDGWPNARTVLLSAVDRTGFAFHTSASSAKAHELAAVPRAAMTVVFAPAFSRQLVVRGDVVRCSPGELAAAYTARSPYLRRLAWLNDDALAALPRAERVARWAAGEPAAGAPEGWTGWRLVPRELTFWVSDADTASRRLQYRRTAEGWRVRPLAG